MSENQKGTEVLIGVIGQGYVGKNYADHLEDEGHTVVRYALEEPYRNNKDRIAECDVVFIGVPTPTSPAGFDDSIVREAVGLVGKGKIAVIKSTLLPGTAVDIQKQYQDRTVMFSPEFLSESTARKDVSNPFVSIVGMTNPKTQREAAELVLSLLPFSPYMRICTSTEAEVFKYAHNVNGYIQVVLFNMLHDFSAELGCEWEPIRDAAMADPYISSKYIDPVHKGGRGAGGNCFIKDFAAFRNLYAQLYPDDTHGITFLDGAAQKNLELLRKSNKDLQLVKGVYGTELE